MLRLALLRIDPHQLPAYRAALREEIEASLRLEPGVIRLDAMAEKSQPDRITIVEEYASREAYEAHLRSPHFQRYKTSTLKMVQNLELVEVDPIR
ncbi:MAG: antibiotic biosynthesis monooxygenase [Candidatus Eremiobacteraeota bacterium]|nr:antibiotic biosynthesis monooxygenase [Candidatus Eremiobacteraeota bacterium]